jgi:hypothetical protein
LAAAGNVTLVNHGDSAALTAAIQARLDAKRRGAPDPPRNVEFVNQFRRERTAKRFAEIVEACVDGEPSLRLVPGARLAEEAA